MTGDLTHPTGTGADVVSGLLVDALEASFQESLAALAPTRPVESPSGQASGFRLKAQGSPTLPCSVPTLVWVGGGSEALSL